MSKIKPYHVKWNDGEVSIILAENMHDLFSHVDSMGSIESCEIRVLENLPTFWHSKDGVHFSADHDECSSLILDIEIPSSINIEGEIHANEMCLGERKINL